MTRTTPNTARPARTAQRTVVSTIVLAVALFLYQSTVIQPGTVAAVGEATPSPLDSPQGSPTPAPAPSIDTSPTAGATLAPEPVPPPSEPPSPSAEPASPEPTPGVTPDATPSPLVGGSLSIIHFTFASVAGPAEDAVYITPDTGLTAVSRFAVVRLRFEVANTGTDPYAWTPQLQVAQDGGEFADVPQTADAAWPFRAAPEWIAGSQGGTEIGPALVDQPSSADAPALLRSSGLNPLPSQTMPGASVLEIEFSIAPTAGAVYDATYVFRLTDAGTELAVAAQARLTMAAMPPLELSPGQRSGSEADAAGRGPVRYQLTPSSISIHTPTYDLVSDACATCHRTHTAIGGMLTAEPTEYALCASCHNGIDAPNVTAAYAGITPNDAAARAYYQHDPTVTEGVLGTTNNCAECHNPHNISDTATTQTAAGWTASGRVAGTGVELEYELCYRCHASPATLPDNTGQPPSRYALDKAAEFDPTNRSYHPIEAAGTNQTLALANSLSTAGTSPYKLWAWDTTSTVRCVNCHADARIAEAALGPPPADPPLAASGSLQVHASTQRGILLAPYQDRTLNGPVEPYQAADFALCYLCHAEAPFVDRSGAVRADTNFRYHGIHVSDPNTMREKGFDGSDIDTPGYGSGFAICAECHFRIHSSAFAADGKAPGLRLVNFAPNVTALVGVPLDWQPRVDATPGSCTLKCHGAPHRVLDPDTGQVIGGVQY